jgi:glycosyltransferase 2 family protein
VRWVNRRPVRVAIGLIITIGFLRIVFHGLDIGRIRASIEQIRWSVLVIAVMFLAAGYAVRTVRWWWTLRACNAPTELRACVWPLLVGVAVNNVVPFRAGDVYRIMVFRQQLRAPAAQLIGTLLIERILDLTVLLGFFLVGVVGLTHSENSAAYTRTALVMIATIALAWTLALMSGKRLEYLFTRLCRHKALTIRGWASAVEDRIHQLFDALNVIRKPGRALGLLALSIVVWSCEGSICEIVAHGLSYHDHIYGPWFAFASGTLSTLIPSSPGYLGTFDFFAMSGLMEFGASRALAVAFAFVVHAVLWLPITGVGITYAVLAGPKPRLAQGNDSSFARSEDKSA